MTYIKLTDAEGRTKNDMEWSVGKTNRATGKGKTLCSNGYLHVYDTPEQAAFMQPIHVPSYTKAFEVHSRYKGITNGTKRGIKSCTVMRDITLPKLTKKQRVEIAIRVSLQIYHEATYESWAKGWLSGQDRTARAARAAHAAVRAAAYWTNAADHAAVCAVAAAARAAYAAASAAIRAAVAAEAAAYAVEDTANAKPLDLLSIIRQVFGKEARNG